MTKTNTGGPERALPSDHEAREKDTSEHLEEMFSDWRRLEKRLSELGAHDEMSVQEKQECDQIIQAQSLLMNTAALLNGSTYRDLLFKLAFWRWDAPELGKSLGEMTRYEALVYSAFRDLVRMTSNENVATDLDRRTNYLREPDAA